MSDKSSNNALAREASKYEDAKEREKERIIEDRKRREEHYNKMLDEYEERKRLPIPIKLLLISLSLGLFSSIILFMMSINTSGKENFDKIMSFLLNF